MRGVPYDRSMVNASGCYAIRHRSTGAFYIGSARRFGPRWWGHRDDIRNGCHCNEGIRLRGTDPGVFSFEILLICSPGDRRMYEDALLRACSEKPGFLNRLLAANAPTAETLAKIVASTSGELNHFWGKKHTPDSIEKQRRVKLGKRASDETRARMSVAQKGRKHGSPSPSTRAKLRSANLGKKASLETRAKMSATRLGMKRGPLSPERRQKISLALKRRNEVLRAHKAACT